MQISIIIYRVGNFLYRSGIPVLPKLISFFNRILFAVQIPSSVEVGRNTKLGYQGLGVVIHSRAKIGSNCIIAQNVTIGRNFGHRNVPIIGDNVYVGAGSVIFGEIVIGNNVIIGSNSVVNRSIPDGTTVAGNPARIIRQQTLPYFELDKAVKLHPTA